MSRLARQAIVLSIARIANYGLMLVSPIILVRVLPIEEFGRYREYLLYVSVLTAFATFSVYESMLYFIPAHPHSRWRVVRQTVQLVAASSVIVVLVIAVADLSLRGSIIGRYLLPVALYVLLYVNLDFWEWYWISRHQPAPVFAYTSLRLIARMLVVISAAVLTRRVDAIIWALMALEAVRVSGSFYFWRRSANKADSTPVVGLLRKQVLFCLTSGSAVLIATITRNAGNFAVVKWLGVVPLALYTTGLYGEPIVVAIRNSISSILLPEMVRRAAESRSEAIRLWKGATVINCIALLPLSVLLMRFAKPLVLMMFGPSYAISAVVLQLYALVIIRECFDLTLPLRATRITAPLVRSSVLGLATNALVMLLLLRPMGIRGAAVAMVAAGLVEAGYQMWCVSRALDINGRELIPWQGVGKVLFAAIASASILIDGIWGAQPGVPGMLAASGAYILLFALLLLLLGVPEVKLLREWMGERRVPAAVLQDR